MQFFLTKGLAETAPLWSDIQQGYAWVYRAAHLLTNDEKQKAAQVRQTYEALLAEMEQTPTSSEALATMLSTFRKVTTSYWSGICLAVGEAGITIRGEISAPRKSGFTLGDKQRSRPWLPTGEQVFIQQRPDCTGEKHLAQAITFAMNSNRAIRPGNILNIDRQGLLAP